MALIKPSQAKILVDILKYVCEDSDHSNNEFASWYRQQIDILKCKNVLKLPTPKARFLRSELNQLIRYYLMTRNFLSLIKVMALLQKIAIHNEITIFRVGLECLINYDFSFDKKNLQQFVRQVCSLRKLKMKEIMLEYTFLSLYNKTQQSEVDSSLKFVIMRQKQRKEETERDKYLSKLFSAYSGLAYYSEWLNFKLEDKTALYRTQEYSEKKMEVSANKSIECFQSLQGVEGVWDIFITKHLQLLSYYGRTDEAVEVVQENARVNSRNPMALRLLYRFYVENNFEPDLITEALANYCKKVPSDELNLTLCLHIKNVLSKLEILFNFVEFIPNKTNNKAWPLILASLTELYEDFDQDNHKLFLRIWSPRESWWLDYHFVLPFTEENFLVKIAVRVLLYGEQPSFTECVLKSADKGASKIVKQTLSTAKDLYKSFR